MEQNVCGLREGASMREPTWHRYGARHIEKCVYVGGWGSESFMNPPCREVVFRIRVCMRGCVRVLLCSWPLTRARVLVLLLLLLLPPHPMSRDLLGFLGVYTYLYL